MKPETRNQKSQATKKQSLFHVSRFTFHEKGYSLIELLVAMGLFSIVVSIMASMFMISLRGQQKAFTAQNVADNMRYAMEIMSKEIRMGSDFNLVSATDLQFKSNMPNRNGATVEFTLAGGQILFDDDIANAPASTAITSSNIGVMGLNFVLYPSGTTQPRVLVSAQASSVGVAADASSSINLETVVAPRILQ